ncbi:MAG: hypothetical protein AB4372_35095 [Xenococcus sp. (in: cyanobacteria)]
MMHTNHSVEQEFANRQVAIILEPLTLEEESERLRLERQVERAFYQAGLALKTLRDQKLYRATHHNFRDYCQERFGFGKSAVYYLISAVDIVDNLKKSPPMVDTLPTSERQVRPLKSLKASQQRKAWAEAVEQAQGVPTAKIVKEVVKQLKKQDKSTELEKHSQSSHNGNTNNIRFVSLENPRIGQQVRICQNHPLFPHQQGIITQITNNRSVIVKFKNQKQSEPIDLKDLEIQRIVDKNGQVSTPSEGINYVRGVGVEWYVRVDEETWNKLDRYAKQTGTATLGAAIARLLE